MDHNMREALELVQSGKATLRPTEESTGRRPKIKRTAAEPTPAPVPAAEPLAYQCIEPAHSLSHYVNLYASSNTTNHEWVSENIDRSVLCANEEGLFAWADIASTKEFVSSDDKQKERWCNPHVWRNSFLTKLLGKSVDRFVVGTDPPPEKIGAELGLSILGSGSHNVVLQALGPHTGLPPQLHAADFVVRMTKLDDPKGYHLKRQALLELCYTLDAAARGIGPEVYGALLFSVKVATAKGNVDKWGTILILEKITNNLLMTKLYDDPCHLWARNRAWDARTLHSLERKVAIPLQKKTEALARACADLCARVAGAGAVNFDMKPENILVVSLSQTSAELRLIDFDIFLYKCSREKPVASFEAAMLANLLLLATHIRAFSPMWHSGHFAATLKDLLFELAVCVQDRKRPEDAWLLETKRWRSDGPDPFGLISATDQKAMASTWRKISNHYFFHPPALDLAAACAQDAFETLLQSPDKSDETLLRLLLEDGCSLQCRDVALRIIANLRRAAKRGVQSAKNEVTSDLKVLTVAPWILRPNRLWWKCSGWGAPQPSQMRELLRFVLLWDCTGLKEPGHFPKPSLTPKQSALVDFPL